jgi:hypothetical protein
MQLAKKKHCWIEGAQLLIKKNLDRPEQPGCHFPYGKHEIRSASGLVMRHMNFLNKGGARNRNILNKARNGQNG